MSAQAGLSPAPIDYYARRASEYERIYAKPERQNDLEQLRGLVTQAVSGRRVLELACGTGYWTQVMAESAEFVLATDRSREVLEVAEGKRLSADRVAFAEADAWRPPASAGPFSAVFAGFWWSHIRKDELRAFLAGLDRAVGPGLKALFIDNRFVPGSSTPLARTDEFGNTWQIRRLDDGSEHEVLKNFPSAIELRAAVEGSGRDVHVTELPYYWMLSYVTGNQ